MAARQDKATADRNARTLRELVKMPQNKFCADCKRNDARWASWNIGCFVCIRCSGIHRSMGTHISKVKSVDLDMWTPEQMASVQKWGNTRANLYWEAHLKPGHMPPDHKMDSFIRSKYESRRWAMDGPPPSDPSILEAPAESAPEPEPAQAPSTSQAAPKPVGALPAPPQTTAPSLMHNPSGSRSGHALLSATHGRNPSIPAPGSSATTAAAPAPAAPAPAQNELFSLDFSSPAPSQPVNSAPKKDVKQDILSLFSSAPAPAPAAQSSLFGAPSMQQQQQPPQSLMGTGGAAMWGADSWSTGPSAVPPAMGGANVWASGQQQQYTNPMANSQNVWAAGGTTQSNGTGFDMFNTPAKPPPKQDDAFGDLWGSFK